MPKIQMTWDNVYSWAQFLTVFFAGVALVSGLVVNKRQARQLLGLQAQSDDSKSAQQKVEVQLSESQTKQAEAERMLLEIQERFTPRTLTGQARDKFLEALTGAARGKIIVSVIGNNPEAFTFASQIRETLQFAGYDLGENMNSFMPMGSAPLVGISIGFKNEKEEPPFAAMLQRAFVSIGIEAPGQIGDITPNLTNDTVVVRVGVKP